jgi:hypothetical protein
MKKQFPCTHLIGLFKDLMFELLPTDTQIIILQFLENKEVLRLMSVSKKLFEVCSLPELWKKM